MAILDFNTSSNNTGEGIFVKEVTIVSVKAQPKDEQGQYPKDIALEIVYRADDADPANNDRKFWVSGSFQRATPNGPITGKGNTFKVTDFIIRTGVVNDLDAIEKAQMLEDLESGELTPSLIPKFSGKRITILDYQHGTYTNQNGEEKTSYRTYDVIQPAGYDKEKFISQFKKDNERRIKAGYKALLITDSAEKQSSSTVTNSII